MRLPVLAAFVVVSMMAVVPSLAAQVVHKPVAPSSAGVVGCRSAVPSLVHHRVGLPSLVTVPPRCLEVYRN
jgi:hypothetical protein